MRYLLLCSVVVDFGHGAKGWPEFVHGWSGWVGLTRQGSLYNTHNINPVLKNSTLKQQHIIVYKDKR